MIFDEKTKLIKEKSERIKKLREAGQEVIKDKKFDIDEDMFLQREYICSTETNTEIYQRERDWITKGIDTEEEETYEWLPELLYPD